MSPTQVSSGSGRRLRLEESRVESEAGSRVQSPNSPDSRVGCGAPSAGPRADRPFTPYESSTSCAALRPHALLHSRTMDYSEQHDYRSSLPPLQEITYGVCKDCSQGRLQRSKKRPPRHAGPWTLAETSCFLL